MLEYLKPNEINLYKAINNLLEKSPIEVRVAHTAGFVFQVVYKTSEYIHQTHNTKYCKVTQKAQDDINALAKKHGLKLSWINDNVITWSVETKIELEECEFFANN